MTATTCAAAAGHIFAIDLGKCKSVACDRDASTAEVAFASFDTTRDELRRRLARLQPAAVVIEACGLSGWVYDLCGELHLDCRVANTASGAWKFKPAKRKADRDGARRNSGRWCACSQPSPASGRAPPRPWPLPRRPAAGDAARRCCASSWSSAPDAACGTTPGREASTCG